MYLPSRKCVLILLIIQFAVLGYFFSSNVAQSIHRVYHFWDCSEEDTRLYLDRFCIDYMNGLVAGGLCGALCRTKEITFTRCLEKHAVKKYVFQAEWKGRLIIVKTLQPYWKHHERVKLLRDLNPMEYDQTTLQISDYIDMSTQITTEEFIKQANATLFYGIGGGRTTESTERVLKQVISECDLRNDGLLRHDEIILCWRMIESEEYMISSILQGNSGVPKILGVCGELYAEAYATPLDSEQYLGDKGSLSNRRSWKFRVEIVLAILDLLEAFEETQLGTLYFCDVKKAHIGLVHENGRIVAKVIDLDSGWFGDSVRMSVFQRNILGRDCNSEPECDILACHIYCNSSARVCTDTLTSSNYQAVCETILAKRPHILQSPPTADIKQELDRIIAACSESGYAGHTQNKVLIGQLRSVLLSSIL